jgi:hypothetical protein
VCNVCVRCARCNPSLEPAYRRQVYMGYFRFFFFSFSVFYTSRLCYTLMWLSRNHCDQGIVPVQFAVCLHSGPFACGRCNIRCGIWPCSKRRCARVEMKGHNVKLVCRLGRFTRATCAVQRWSEALEQIFKIFRNRLLYPAYWYCTSRAQ